MSSPIKYSFLRQQNNLKVAILVNQGCRRYGVEYFANRLIRFYYIQPVMNLRHFERQSYTVSSYKSLFC